LAEVSRAERDPRYVQALEAAVLLSKKR
jgi:hypothetical protein